MYLGTWTDIYIKHIVNVNKNTNTISTIDYYAARESSRFAKALNTYWDATILDTDQKVDTCLRNVDPMFRLSPTPMPNKVFLINLAQQLKKIKAPIQEKPPLWRDTMQALKYHCCHKFQMENMNTLAEKKPMTDKYIESRDDRVSPCHMITTFRNYMQKACQVVQTGKNRSTKTTQSQLEDFITIAAIILKHTAFSWMDPAMSKQGITWMKALHNLVVSDQGHKELLAMDNTWMVVSQYIHLELYCNAISSAGMLTYIYYTHLMVASKCILLDIHNLSEFHEAARKLSTCIDWCMTVIMACAKNLLDVSQPVHIITLRKLKHTLEVTEEDSKTRLDNILGHASNNGILLDEESE
ncbi:hypothetical protein V8E55_010339 [Tylopilus felleus]